MLVAIELTEVVGVCHPFQYDKGQTIQYFQGKAAHDMRMIAQCYPCTYLALEQRHSPEVFQRLLAYRESFEGIEVIAQLVIAEIDLTTSTGCAGVA